MDHLIDEGVFFCGDPQTVTQRIKQFYQDLGGFGTLLLVCGKDWGTWEQRQRSWQLLMNEVAPHLNELDG
jgi:alkanesulfonate monooxygenase SsuD/methylene tetrahydromethanopterin reductase-like flavin-dependent oxidoreductase (luciferase family)